MIIYPYRGCAWLKRPANRSEKSSPCNSDSMCRQYKLLTRGGMKYLHFSPTMLPLSDPALVTAKAVRLQELTASPPFWNVEI